MEIMKGNFTLEETGKLWERAGRADIADAFFRASDAEKALEIAESKLAHYEGLAHEVRTLCDDATDLEELIRDICVLLKNED